MAYRSVEIRYFVCSALSRDYRMTRPSYTPVLFATIFWLCISFVPIHAQNFVPNPSFEIYSICPTNVGMICQDVAPPWNCATTGSCDYFHTCADPASGIDIPANGFGSQSPLTGNAYAGLLYKGQNATREYLQVHLAEPLIADQWYVVSYYVSLAENYCPTFRFGVYFSNTLTFVNTTSLLVLDPQVEWMFGYITNTVEWTLISGCFQAEGDEEYMILGNFYDNNESFGPSGCETGSAYYYVDDVSLMEVDPPGELDPGLEDYAFDCDLYEIVPTHQGPLFLWSDGSDGPTLTVTTSGVYAVTISDGCSVGIDSIEVEIAEDIPPVELPVESLLLCDGETYSIQLDPQFETYTWQDGSTGPFYEIDGPGVYTVTLIDGCHSSSDVLTVEYISPPPVIDLGPDLQVCMDEEVTWQFDPSWGEYLWQDGTDASMYTADDTGLYAVTISNPCGETSDEMMLEFFNPPYVDLGDPPATLCQGHSIVFPLDPAGGAISWQDGSNDEYYEIFTPGTYSVTITNICGTVTDQIEVILVDPPVVALGIDQVLCPGESVILTAIGAEGLFQWQDGSNENFFEVSASGEYFLTVTNDCGSGIDTVHVLLQDTLAPISLGQDFSLCPSETAWLFAGTTDGQVVWSNGTFSDSLLVIDAGTYAVTISNACDQETDTIHVVTEDDPPAVDLPDTLTYCDGEMLTIEAGLTGVTYQWNTQAQTPSIVVTQAGWYSVLVSNACGSDTDSVFVMSNGVAPQIELGTDQNICEGDTIIVTPNFNM